AAAVGTRRRGRHSPLPLPAGPRARGVGTPVGRPGAAAVSVAELLEGRHVCVCAGSGGVGKTTTSAAIAMGMAARGLKVEDMAIERLYELHEEGSYDLIVLDTPPTRNALEFLEAPDRLARFVDSRSLQFFLRPGIFGVRALGRGTGLILAGLKRVTGSDLI